MSTAAINERILEIRYRPNPKIIDYRGSWAEVISDHMSLPKWRILSNRIDIFNDDDSERVFVGFRNAGYVAHDTPTKNYFTDKSVKFFRFLFTLTGFEKEPLVERTGVRSKFLREYQGTFNELREKYTSSYLSLTEKAKLTIKAELVDIGGPLNFVDKLGNFNTISGPMAKDQMGTVFAKKRDFPDVGLFFDIDYWLTPKEKITEKALIKKIANFSNACWDRFADIDALILE